MVGGTAIALYLGHRKSIDFDLFTNKKIMKRRIWELIAKHNLKHVFIHEEVDQLHLVLNSVKVTFFEYKYDIPHEVAVNKIITIPTLKDLAAMKAFAMARRSKWKDFVDLYFLIKNNFTIEEISQRAIELFPDQFSEKLFRSQLTYHKDINYSEEVEYIIPNPPTEEEIKAFLLDKATERF